MKEEIADAVAKVTMLFWILGLVHILVSLAVYGFTGQQFNPLGLTDGRVLALVCAGVVLLALTAITDVMSI